MEPSTTSSMEPEERRDGASKDITDVLKQASQQLRIGEMIHGDDFELAKIMNAVEIGDRRLDAGMPPAESSDLPSANGLPTDLSPRQALDIIDHVMVLEATWYSGSNLAQTVYTCRYLLEQERIKHLASLSAFLDSAKALSKQLSDIILAAGVTSEEDIVAYTFGFDFGLGSKLLVDAAGSLQHVIKNTPHRDDEVAAQTLSRLVFRYSFLQALARISLNTKRDIEDGKKLLFKALNELRRIGLGRNDSSTPPPGFHPDLNRERTGPMASRKVQPLSGPQAHDQWQKLIEELTEVCRIAKIASWAELNRFLDEFAQKTHGPIARCLLARLITQSSSPGQPQPWQPCVAMMQNALGIPPLASLSSPLGIPAVFSQYTLLAQSIAQIKCMNRARQRRRHRRLTDDWVVLMTSIIDAESSPEYPEWLALAGWQWQFQDPRSKFQKIGPLQTWMERECCRTMVTHLFLGFELECYMPHEYSMIYWYCEHLLGILLDSANILSLRFPRPLPEATGKRKSQPKLPNALAKFSPQALELLNQARIALMERQLCRGYMRLALALAKAGDIAPRAAPFNHEEHVYEQRFYYFHALPTPAYIHYQDYLLSTAAAGTDSANLLRSSLVNFQDARTTASSLVRDNASDVGSYVVAQAEQVDKIAKQNSVALQLLASDLEAQMKNQALLHGEAHVQNSQIRLSWHVTWDFSQHSFFPLLKLSKCQ